MDIAILWNQKRSTKNLKFFYAALILTLKAFFHWRLEKLFREIFKKNSLRFTFSNRMCRASSNFSISETFYDHVQKQQIKCENFIFPVKAETCKKVVLFEIFIFTDVKIIIYTHIWIMHKWVSHLKRMNNFSCQVFRFWNKNHFKRWIERNKVYDPQFIKILIN